MADSTKRTERIPLNVSEREMLDLAHEAGVDNRTVSDLVYVIVRRYLYGRLGARAVGVEQSRGADQARGVRDFSDTSFRGGEGQG